MKKFVLAFGILCAGIGSWLYYEYDKVSYLSKKTEEDRRSVEKVLSFINAFNETNDLDVIQEQIGVLPEEQREFALKFLNYKLAMLRFEQAECMLENIGNLQEALKTDEMKINKQYEYEYNYNDDEDDEETKELHPMVNKMYNEMVKSYAQAKKYIGKIDEAKRNDLFNHSVYYLKGEISYRNFQLADAQQKLRLFEETLEAYKKALKFKPGDTDTEVNIELLVKCEPSGGSSPDVSKLKHLKQMRPGRKKPKGHF